MGEPAPRSVPVSSARRAVRSAARSAHGLPRASARRLRDRRRDGPDRAAGADPQLVSAAQTIPDPRRCGDLDALVAEPAPRKEIATDVAALRSHLARVRVLMTAGRTGVAATEAIDAVTRARAIGERRWISEALLVQGQTKISVDPAAVIAPLGEAVALALATGADAVAVEAWARRAFALAVTGNPAAAQDGHEIVEALAARSTTTPYARTMLYTCLGSVAAASDRMADAHASWLRAVDEGRALDGADAELAAKASSPSRSPIPRAPMRCWRRSSTRRPACSARITPTPSARSSFVGSSATIRSAPTRSSRRRASASPRCTRPRSPAPSRAGPSLATWT